MSEEYEETQPGQNGFGYLLKAAREARELSLDEVCRQLNLHRNIVSAIESEDFQSLPPAAFVRGYLRGYARLVGITDNDALVRDYNNRVGADPIPIAMTRIGEQPRSNHPVMRWTTVIIVLLLLTLLAAWLISNSDGSATSESPEETSQSVPAESALSATLPEPVPSLPRSTPRPLTELVISATEPGGEAGTPLETVPQQEASADSESATPSVTAADTDSADAPTELIEPVDEVSETTAPSSELVSNTEPQPEPESAQSAPVAEADAVEAPVVKVPPPATPSPVSGNDVLALSSDEDSWIEISDALGNRLMFDMLRPGDSRTLRGTAPFRVFLGNAPPVSLEVNGKPVSRPRVSSRNTARFVVESDGDQHQ